MADAGKILIMPKGSYSSTSEYEVLDLVNHRGTSWVAKQNVKGIEPSDSNSEHWFKMAGYIVADNLNTTAEGYVLDARQGKLLQDELEVERARINQLTTLAEGSTTGDAELIDARVGADGKTYANLGEANRTQFTNLKSDLSELKDDLGNNIPLNWIANCFVRLENGQPYEIETYNLTDFVEITASIPICVKTRMINDLSALCYYDERKVFISGLNIPSNTLTETLLDVPSNAKYIRFSCLASENTSDAYLKYVGATTKIVKAVANNEEKLSEIENNSLRYDEPYTAEVTKNEGYYIANSGNIYEISTYFFTESLAVHCGDKITVTSKDPSGEVVSRISKWTESGTYIETIDFGTKNETTVMYVVKEETEYIRFSGYITNEMTITVQRAVVSPVLENVVKSVIKTNPINTVNAMYTYSVEKVLCIGDSLTSGACYINGWMGTSIDQNYPKYLARMLNCEVTNAGRSGWSASDWYRDYINTYDFANYDAFVIWLGTNYGCGAMPTDAEINAFIPDTSVSAENANQALYLIEIIKRIQTANTDAYILLGNCFASKSNVATNNATIEIIAEKYGCVLLDMSDLQYDVKSELHGNVANPHFGKAGNIFIADRICKRINEDIIANPLRAEFGYTVRTN